MDCIVCLLPEMFCYRPIVLRRSVYFRPELECHSQDQSSNLVCFLTHYPFSTPLMVFMVDVCIVKKNARVCAQCSCNLFVCAMAFYHITVLLCSGLYAAMSHNLICSSKVKVLFLLSLILYESQSCLTIQAAIIYFIILISPVPPPGQGFPLSFSFLPLIIVIIPFPYVRCTILFLYVTA